MEFCPIPRGAAFRNLGEWSNSRQGSFSTQVEHPAQGFSGAPEGGLHIIFLSHLSGQELRSVIGAA
eukprot:7787304-Pyramimonas_sp.AAC.1